MSDILREIKEAHMRFRKDGDDMAKTTSTIIGEIELEDKKRKGNKPLSDEDIIKILKSNAKGMETVISLIDDCEMKTHTRKELDFINKWIPEMLSKEELVEYIKSIPSGQHIGATMKQIKQQFGSRVDMRQASTILKEI